MSYFSHNPEAYDEICVKAITDKLLLNASLDATEEQYEFLQLVVDNLYHARVPIKPGAFGQFCNLTDGLLDWAHEEIVCREQKFWERLVP